MLYNPAGSHSLDNRPIGRPIDCSTAPRTMPLDSSCCLHQHPVAIVTTVIPQLIIQASYVTKGNAHLCVVNWCICSASDLLSADHGCLTVRETPNLEELLLYSVTRGFFSV